MTRTHHGERWPSRAGRMLALSGILAAATAVAAMAATSHPAAAPSNTSPPTISGTAAAGSTLTVANGNWNGSTPISYAYQWRRCDSSGGSCSDISGATQASYTLKPVDAGNTLRATVTASNSDGASRATTVPTAVVSAGAPPSGCPSASAGATVAVADVSSPARLTIDRFEPSPSVIPGTMTSFTLRVRVADTCGQPVSGAAVYGTAVPYNQVNVPAEASTDANGWVTLSFNRLRGFPAATKQRLMVMFLRARRPGENPLTGITGSRLISFPVALHAAA